MKNFSPETIVAFERALRLLPGEAAGAAAKSSHKGGRGRRGTGQAAIQADDRLLLLALTNLLYYKCGITDARLPKVDDPQAIIRDMEQAKQAMRGYLPDIIHWATEEAVKQAKIDHPKSDADSIRRAYHNALSDTPDSIPREHRVIMARQNAALRDNVLYRHVHNAYAHEIFLLKDMRPVQTISQTMLFRGIPKSDHPDDLSQKALDTGFYQGHTHLPPVAAFNFSAKTRWWQPDRNTYGVSTTMFSPIALKYAFSKGNNSGYIYIIVPPAGEEFLSFTHYGSWGSHFWEMTAPQIPAAWIRERITVTRDAKNKGKYTIQKVEKNPHFRGDPHPLPAEQETLLPHWEHSTGRLLSVGDVFKPGTVIERKTGVADRISNLFGSVLSRLGKGTKISEHYLIKHGDSEGIYNGLEQAQTYNIHYRKNKAAPESGHHTSKRAPKYRSESDFKRRYTIDKLKERRQDEWGAMMDHGVRKKASYGEKLAATQGIWPALYDSLKQIGRGEQFLRVKALLLQTAMEYQRSHSQSGWLAELDFYRAQLARDIMGTEYENLTRPERHFINRQVELLDQYRYQLKQEVEKTLQQGIELKKGVYGGIGAKVVIVGGGLQIEEVARNSPAEKVGLKAGMRITAITQGGIQIDFTGHKLNEEEVARLFRRLPSPSENLIVHYQDRTGTAAKALMQRDFIDSKHGEAYQPVKKADLIAQVRTHTKTSGSLRLEYQHRAEALPKYTADDGTPLSQAERETLRRERQEIKAVVRS